MRIDIEDDGLQALLVGLNNPSLLDNRLCRKLHSALSLEWTCRRAAEANTDILEIDGRNATEAELKMIAGLLYGFSIKIDCGKYPKTFWFCFNALQGFLAELEVKGLSAKKWTVH